MPASTIRDFIVQSRHRLQEAGLSPSAAALDARLLAAHALGWTSAAVLADSADPAPPDFAPRYADLVTRRCRREPLAYITGRKEFWNLTFDVSPAVLIPRPETELLVEAVLEHASDPLQPLAIVDVCTGCGCVGVAIATERPRAHIVATDLSSAALAVARQNARNLGVGPRIACVQSDLLAGIRGRFDIVTANPPYVAERDGPGLQPEVREFEPAIALFGGRLGLSIVERLLAESHDRLAPDGLLIFEFGAGQDDAVLELISASGGLRMLEVKADLAGIPRVAVLTRA